MASIFLEGMTSHELTALIKDSVKEEFQNAIKEQKENPSEKTNTLLTRKETCKLLGISLPTLHTWSMSNLIPSYRINTRIRYKKEDIDKLLANPRGLKYQSKNEG